MYGARHGIDKVEEDREDVQEQEEGYKKMFHGGN